MDSVFDFIFTTLRDYVEVMKQFKIEAYGFTVNVFDFLVGLLILANLLPIFFVSRDTRSGGSRSSERNREE